MPSSTKYLILIGIVFSFSCNAFLYPNQSVSDNNSTPAVEVSSSAGSNSEWLLFLEKSNARPEYEGAIVDNNENVFFLKTTEIEGGDLDFDLTLVKITSDGEVDWELPISKITYSGSHVVASIISDNEGNIYISATTKETWGNPLSPFSPNGKHNEDVFLVKINNSGDILWNTFLGNSSIFSNMVWDENNNIGILVGSIDSPTNAILVRLNSNGELLDKSNSQLKMGSSSSQYYFGKFAIGKNSDIYLLGDDLVEQDIFIAKFSPKGDLIWKTSIGGLDTWEYGPPYEFAFDNNNNTYILGEGDGNWGKPINPYDGGYIDGDPNGRENFVAKIDSNGILEWHTFLNKSIYATGFFSNPNGLPYLAGMSTSTWGNPINEHSGGNDVFISQISTDGSLIWNTFVGGEGNELIYDMIPNHEQYFYIIGSSDVIFGNPQGSIPANNDNGEHYIFVAKIKLQQ